jgi:hypothetical protein
MAGYVQTLDYDMYDVAIHVLNPEQVPNMANLHFNIVYVSKYYTMYQMTARSAYCGIACLVFLCYAT